MIRRKAPAAGRGCVRAPPVSLRRSQGDSVQAEDDGSLALARMLAGQEQARLFRSSASRLHHRPQLGQQSPLGFDVTHSTLRRFSTLEEVRHWPRGAKNAFRP